jgi:hypothetical protein
MSVHKVGVAKRILQRLDDFVDRVAEASTPDDIPFDKNTVASLYTSRLSVHWNEPHVTDTLDKL